MAAEYTTLKEGTEAGLRTKSDDTYHSVLELIPNRWKPLSKEDAESARKIEFRNYWRNKRK